MVGAVIQAGQYGVNQLVSWASLIYVAIYLILGFLCTPCECVQAFGNYLQLPPSYATCIHSSYLIKCQETYVARDVLWVKDTNGIWFK